MGSTAEGFLQRCHEAVLRRLTDIVGDTIRDLGELWKESQDAVLALLRIATADIVTHSQLAELIEDTIDEQGKVKRLDPEQRRIAITRIPGQLIVDATRDTIWHHIQMRVATLALVAEEEKFGLLSQFGQQVRRSRDPKAIELQSTSTTSVSVLPSSTPVARPAVSVANESTTSAAPETDFAGPVVASLSANMEEGPHDIIFDLQGSLPTVQEIETRAMGNPSNKGVGYRTQEVLRKCVLATSLDPLVSRVKAEAMSSMTEGLSEMGAFAQRAALGALEGCYKDVETRMKALESEDPKQFRAETLERLVCWGNLVAAQGAIQAMKRMKNEPVTRVPSSRPSSSLLVASPSSSSSPFVRGMSRDPVV